MRHTIKVPPVGADDNDLYLVEWQVTVGQEVSAGQMLATVEASKTQVEIPCPISGRVVDLLVDVEADVSVGMPLCVLES